MPKASNQLYKGRQSADRRRHEEILQELFQEFDLLNVDGLDENAVIWKARDYHYMHGHGHTDEGKYERMPGPDIVVFYQRGGSLHFLVVEVKGSELGRSFTYGSHQLDRAKSYFKGLWRASIVNEIRPHLLQRLTEFPDTDVFLSLLMVTKEMFEPYKIIPYEQNIHLGKVRGSFEKDKVYFS